MLELIALFGRFFVHWKKLCSPNNSLFHAPLRGAPGSSAKVSSARGPLTTERGCKPNVPQHGGGSSGNSPGMTRR